MFGKVKAYKNVCQIFWSTLYVWVPSERFHSVADGQPNAHGTDRQRAIRNVSS